MARGNNFQKSSKTSAIRHPFTQMGKKFQQGNSQILLEFKLLHIFGSLTSCPKEMAHTVNERDR